METFLSSEIVFIYRADAVIANVNIINYNILMESSKFFDHNWLNRCRQVNPEFVHNCKWSFKNDI